MMKRLVLLLLLIGSPALAYVCTVYPYATNPGLCNCKHSPTAPYPAERKCFPTAPGERVFYDWWMCNKQGQHLYLKPIVAPGPQYLTFMEATMACHARRCMGEHLACGPLL